MIGTLIDSKAHNQQPFAIALALLKEQGGQLELDDFKQRVFNKTLVDGNLLVIDIVLVVGREGRRCQALADCVCDGRPETHRN